MLFGGLMMVLFWGGIIALIVSSMRGRNRNEGEAVFQQRPTPLEFLQERYARGEIDKREYEERRKDLSR